MSEQYPDKVIFGNYERNVVLSWINELQYFTFARGGLNEFIKDGDEFVVTFAYTTPEDLQMKLASLGIELRRTGNERTFNKDLPADKKKNNPEWAQVIDHLPNYIQPKFQKLFDTDCFVFVGEHYFWISISNTIGSGEWWRVYPEDVEACKKLEQKFDETGLKDSRIYDMENYGRFVNRNNYPQYFHPPVEGQVPERRTGNEN